MIVDFRGRPVSAIPVAGSSLVKGLEWQEWLEANWATISEGEPWCRLLMESVINLHQSFIIMSRRYRKNQYWAGSATMADDTVSLVQDAEARLAIYEKNVKEVSLELIPHWAQLLFESVQAGFRMQVRIAREAEQILKKGHLLVNVNPRAQDLRDARELGHEVEESWTG